ncbi:2-amino-4-hydroxy-6-hydroxymethyldihydropteridine diphosphokinase [Mucilaginibacter aquatilis]|uniref:2-amino-4-hydroxy-6-hydroxymethyldihydropteridine pyrophosphokinase n=1 Tax=Mucilaginibacter aquatilis TaxID=1517760 RepID=A0A6I4IPC8_9SPHI|nr:2-amino-4-hydroxy-6-hydroxymethyldihydropteridine diphosphokinase [Mucilaginibacter aquatilis]MVN89763.1 2-amino-4-hydroxy-6-hydroxymethyldihydropteridine diphosphokinase [Mucilaginibacter aquatilis]
MVSVYLLLGSNLGNRQMFLQQAADYISAQVRSIQTKSGVYETQSWGKTDLPDYLNQVLLIQTQLSAEDLLNNILAIELLLGRERLEKWGARTIDIDILFYGDEIINKPNLVVPHPELHNRRFTLEPLAEIAPNFVHPLLQTTINELKNDLQDKSDVKKIYF